MAAKWNTSILHQALIFPIACDTILNAGSSVQSSYGTSDPSSHRTTLVRTGSDLESHLDRLRSEPAHSRFAVEEFDRGLVVLDISYSTDGFVYDGG
jgi:hypothetical protein